MSTVTAPAVTMTQNAVTVMAADNITFPQLAGVLVFCIAIAVGCMLGNALFRRF